METFVHFDRVRQVSIIDRDICFMTSPDRGYYVDKEGMVGERHRASGGWFYKPLVSMDVLRQLERKSAAHRGVGHSQRPSEAGEAEPSLTSMVAAKGADA